MANYSLVVNSKFRPYSFDELVKPYMMYGQAYDEQQNQLSDLAVKSNVWKGLANEQTDPTAYKMYKTYADDLETRAGMLAKEGLTPASRKSMLDMKTRYSSEITPLENAWKARDDQRKVQEQLQTQDPTLLLSRKASTTSLDDYIKNPELSYNSYSGKLATAQVAQAAGALAKELKNYGTGKPIDAFTNTFMKKYGFSSSEVLNAINNPKDPKSSKVLGAIVDQAVGSSGVANWNNPQELARVQDYAKQGLWSAVGTTEVAPMENFGARLRAQEAMQLRAERRAAENERKHKLSLSLTPNFDRRNVRTDKDEKDILNEDKDWKKYKNYFMRTSKGHWKLTPEGRSQSLTTTHGSTNGGGITYKEYTVDSDFGRFIKKHGLTEMYYNRTGPYQSANIDKLIGRINRTYDVNTATEYTRGVHPSQYDNVIAILNSSATDGKVHNYSRVKKGNSYDWNRGDAVAVNELTATDIKSATGVYGKHGNYLEVKLKNGTTLDVPVLSYSNNYSNLLSGNSGTIDGYRAMLKDGKTHYKLPTGEVLPIESLINSELNAMGDNFMSSLGLSEINPVKVDRGEYATQVE